MPIIYALVARGTNVLAEHTTTSGNFTTITRKLLEKIPADAQRMSYVYAAPPPAALAAARRPRASPRAERARSRAQPPCARARAPAATTGTCSTTRSSTASPSSA
jgi:hypothetical protein